MDHDTFESDVAVEAREGHRGRCSPGPGPPVHAHVGAGRAGRARIPRTTAPTRRTCCSKASPAPDATGKNNGGQALGLWTDLKNAPAAAIGPTARFADVTGDGVQGLLDRPGRATLLYLSTAAQPPVT